MVSGVVCRNVSWWVSFIVGLPARLSEGVDLFGKPHACLFGASLNLLSANECGGSGVVCCQWGLAV